MRISVITCTRNRSEHIGRLVRAILESTHPDFEHLIVDQSPDDATRLAVAEAAGGDRRIRYYHRAEPGKSKAMNYALERAGSQIIAFTDDDCEPHRDWLEVLARLFHTTTADIICGKVSSASHDHSKGNICGYDPGPAHMVGGRWCSVRQLGVGANMAVRRAVFDRIGVFDEFIGPGGIIPSGDDRDFLYRAAKSQCRILMTPEPEVVHYGFRPWASDARDYGRRNSIGLAVPYTKYIRQRDVAALYRYMTDFLGDARHAAGRVARWQRPLGINRLRFYLAGVAYGMKHPLDRSTMVFRDPK